MPSSSPAASPHLHHFPPPLSSKRLNPSIIVRLMIDDQPLIIEVDHRLIDDGTADVGCSHVIEEVVEEHELHQFTPKHTHNYQLE